MKEFNCDSVLSYIRNGKYPNGMTPGEFKKAIKSMSPEYKECLLQMLEWERPKSDLSYYTPIFLNLTQNALRSIAVGFVIATGQFTYEDHPSYLRSLSTGIVSGVSAFFALETYDLTRLDNTWKSCDKRIAEINKVLSQDTALKADIRK